MLALQNVAFPTSIQYAADIDITLNNDQQLKDAVDNISRRYQTINVAEAMSNLANVGSLLQLAYAGSKGFPSSVKVAEIMCNYQSLIKDTWLASASFVESSLLSLRYHKFALRYLKEKHDADKAMEMIVKTGETAGKMATYSQQLAFQSQTLCERATEALSLATTDNNVTTETRNKVNNAIAELKAETASLQKLTTDLAQAIDEAREEERKAAEQAKKERKRGFLIKLIAAVAAPVATPIEIFAKVQEKNQEAIKNCLELEKGVAQRRVNLQEMQRAANSKLASSISKLASSKSEKNELEKAIASLEVAVKTLGRIRTIFDNTRVFWTSVQRQCERLANTGLVSDAIDFEDEFEESIKESGLCWLALGKINLIASESIAVVNNKVDAIMCDLPNKAEADQLIAKLTSSMLDHLEQENRLLAN